MSSKFLFTISTGRCGTVYLANLLKNNLSDACIHHERLGYQNFGVVTPDASHFTLFNSVGNVAQVQSFWNQKFCRDKLTENEWYIEVSHFLAKAGLIENLNILQPLATEIHILIQTRDIFDTLWSFVNRFDFFNLGFTWLFALDPRYPNIIVDSHPFQKHGMFGCALWYITEMYCRAEYYRQLFHDNSKLHFHSVPLESIIKEQGAKVLLSSITGEDIDDVQLPAKINATRQEYLGPNERELCLQLVEQFRCDPTRIAKKFINTGRRLAVPGCVQGKSFSTG